VRKHSTPFTQESTVYIRRNYDTALITRVGYGYEAITIQARENSPKKTRDRAAGQEDIRRAYEYNT
jgi:hypothetical protein